MEARTPTVRMRIEHSRTIKDGWGYSTTVEITSVGELDPLTMQALLVRVRLLGEEERDERNRRDAARDAAREGA